MSSRGAKRRGDLLVLRLYSYILPGACHGPAALAMTVVVGRWYGFAGVRRLIRCIPRNAGDGVPYGKNCRATPPGMAASAPLRVGATLAVVPGPTIHGGGAAASRPPYGDSSSTAAK